MFKMSFLLFMFTGLLSFGHQIPASTSTPTYALQGKITDAKTLETIPFANVLLYIQDSVKVSVATTDLDGNYYFKKLSPGNYHIEVVYVGYDRHKSNGITIIADQTATLNLSLDNHNVIELDEVIVVQYSMPIKSLNAVSYCTVTREDYKMSKRASRKKRKDGNLIVRGSRASVYNTEEYSKINDNEFKDSKKDPLSTFSIDVDRASYSNVRRMLNDGTLPKPDAVRIEELINYFSYSYPQPEHNQPFSITTEYTDCPWNSKHQLIHIGMQGKQVALENLPTNNLVFLIDVSGSMNSEDKLPLLKSGLRLLVEQMRPQDHVSIVVYAGAAGLVLPSTSGEQKETIYQALEKLEAGGATAGGEGILLAYKTAREHFITKGNNRIILATDGDFNVGISSDGELTRLIEKERENGIFLSVLGFGSGNYKDSKMEQLADKGNGNYAYIDRLLEAKKVLVKEMGGTLLTIAKDVKLQIEFNPGKVKAYRLVGYENRLLNNEDFNDDKKDAGELGAGHTVTAIYEIIPAGSSEPVTSIDNLKYQQTTVSPLSSSNEVMTIKFRYKEPKEIKSKLITHIVTDKKMPFESASENCRFSCAVAEFGMLLRDSKFKGNADFKNIMMMAKNAKGIDDEGYRAEFIKLVETAELLKK